MKKTKAKSTLPFMVLSTAVIASTIASAMPVHAMEVSNGQDSQKAQDTDSAKHVIVPLLKSTNPAIGDTQVRPDQNIVFQLDPQAKQYKMVSHMLEKGFISAYLLDGTNANLLPKTAVQFDATTGQVTVSHDVLTHYKQYSIVLSVSPKDNHQDEIANGLLKNIKNADVAKKINDAIPKMDIVTGVDTVAKTVTLLNHGTVSFDSAPDEVKKLMSNDDFKNFVSAPDEVKNFLDKDQVKADDKDAFNPASFFKVGDVVYANTVNDKPHITMKDPVALSTLFTTGSAIGEATHVSAHLESDSVRVTDTGHLAVDVTDDYGDKATDATLKVTGQGTGNAKVASTFQAPDSIQITNGEAVVDLNDHSANNVALQYTVQDNQYKEAVDTQTGTTSEKFRPGVTAQLTATNPDKTVVGKSYTVKGVALDVYGNSVEDGTQINETTQGGNISNQVATQDGNFSFDFTAPTKSGADSIQMAGADSNVTSNDGVQVHPDVTAQVQLSKTASIMAGNKVTISGVAKDQYGNTVDDGTQINENTQNGVISNPVATLNGAFSFDYQAPTKVGAYDVSIGAGDSTFSMTDTESIVHNVASKAVVSVPSNLQVGQNATISGTVQDQYGNAVNNSPVALTGALTGTATTDTNGQFSLSAKVVQSGTVSANVGGQAISLNNANGQGITSITTQQPAQTLNNIGVTNAQNALDGSLSTYASVASGGVMYIPIPKGTTSIKVQMQGGVNGGTNDQVQLLDGNNALTQFSYNWYGSIRVTEGIGMSFYGMSSSYESWNYLNIISISPSATTLKISCTSGTLRSYNIQFN